MKSGSVTVAEGVPVKKRHYRLRLVISGGICAALAAGCGGTPATKATSATNAGSATTTTAAGQSNATASSSLHGMLPASIQKSGVIRVGVNAITPPFDYKANGKFTGIEAAMRTVMANELGVKFDPTVIVPFSALLPALQSGREDMIMGEMTDTAAREKIVNFVD